MKTSDILLLGGAYVAYVAIVKPLLAGEKAISDFAGSAANVPNEIAAVPKNFWDFLGTQTASYSRGLAAMLSPPGSEPNFSPPSVPTPPFVQTQQPQLSDQQRTAFQAYQQNFAQKNIAAVGHPFNTAPNPAYVIQHAPPQLSPSQQIQYTAYQAHFQALNQAAKKPSVPAPKSSNPALARYNTGLPGQLTRTMF